MLAPSHVDTMPRACSVVTSVAPMVRTFAPRVTKDVPAPTSEAMDWLERSYDRRPGRLRRTLTDLPFDHQGLAVDPRYARLLRVAGMEDLL